MYGQKSKGKRLSKEQSFKRVVQTVQTKQSSNEKSFKVINY